MSITAAELARTIDHTLLKPEATAAQIEKLCEEACIHGFHSVCVNPIHVGFAAGLLASNSNAGEDTPRPSVVSVSGFPLGASSTAVKADEAWRAIDDGAAEVDMVVRVGALVDGDYVAVTKDIEAVAGAVHQALPEGILKVILETRVLTDEQIIEGCRCCTEAGADFVKTSTGLHPAGGATVDHVRLLCKHAAPLPVKAAGGIRTLKAALAMLEAGAARIGTSSGVAILAETCR